MCVCHIHVYKLICKYSSYVHTSYHMSKFFPSLINSLMASGIFSKCSLTLSKSPD